jgi:acetoin:2,6-dichlorophenolindophenol oxidoreductase subunit beta
VSVEQQDMMFVEALRLAMEEALSKDERVILLGEDIADPSGGILGATKGLSTKYGDDRVRDTPISEAAIVGAAIGAAMAGYRPVAEIMIMDFIGIAIDQIVNHAAKVRFMTAGRMSSPITVRTATLGGHGTGATHSQSLEAWFTHIPGIKVAVPATPADAKGLLTTAIFDDDPVVFVETGVLYGTRGPVPVGDYSLPFGQAQIERAGSDVTVITYGRGVRESLAAAAALQEEGVSVEVLNLRTLVPLDVDGVLQSVSKTRRAVVAHYATRFSGPGAEIAAIINEELFGQMAAPVARVGAKFTPIPQAKALESAALPQSSDIAEAIRRVARR